MKIRQLRNATTLITLGDRCLLFDPMLAKPGSFPGFKVFGGGRRANPLVALPEGTEDALEAATDVLVTHEHPDHLDVPGIRWIRERGLPVWASGMDAPNLKRKGLKARALPDPDFGMPVEVVPGKHGRGLIGWMMGPVAGFYLAHPDEPSVYVTGDTVLTSEVSEAISRLRPDVVVAPAGAANFGIGSNLLFSLDELSELARSSPGDVIFYHLESLDHCSTTRTDLRQRVESQGLAARVHIPEDGEVMHFERRGTSPHAAPADRAPSRPGFQKWLTAFFTMT